MTSPEGRSRRVISDALERLISSGPRVISAWSGVPPVLVFSDGACEQEGQKVTHGAVMIDLHHQRFLYFGDDVPADWVSCWRKAGKSQLICQAEIFPMIVAKRTWSKEIRGRSILWFVDNSSAQSSLVRSYSPVAENYDLLVLNADLDVRLQTLNWYARVPSRSNPGDAPSRLEFESLDKNGYARCMPCYDLHDRVGN